MLQRNITDEELSISTSEAGLWSITPLLSSPTLTESREEEIKSKLHFYISIRLELPHWLHLVMFRTLSENRPHFLADLPCYPTQVAAAAFQAINLGKMYKRELCVPPLLAQNNFLSCWPCLVFCRVRVVNGRDQKEKGSLTNGLHVCFYRPA